jgi:nicotinamide-nucleotide amidase
MKAAILSIGTELTRGELANGNARWLGERLTDLGFEVVEHAAVADDAERIRMTLLRLGCEVSVIVCTGGLGPTTDDLTTAAVAAALGVPLVRDMASLEAMEERYRTWKRVMPPSNAKQADFPEGASILPNAAGTAPGFSLKVERAQAFFVPGVPLEMEHIFDAHIVPAIASLAERNSHQVHVRTFGLPESAVAERLRDLDLGGERHSPGVILGYRVTFPEVEVKVLASAQNLDAARELAESVAVEVRARLSDIAYGGKSDTYPGHVGALLTRADMTLALAESCTGGLIGKLLTDVPGSSRYVLGGAIAYANRAKVRLLGVPKELLRAHGAVSEEVARAMAEGALHATDADLAIAVTGVAGPDGGTADKPVGTVCFALAQKQVPTRVCTELFPGDRTRVRLRTAYTALRLVAAAAQENIDAREGARVDKIESTRRAQ